MTVRTTSRFGLVSSATAAALLLFAMPVAAMAQTATYQFDIPAGDLGSALKAYGRASSQQLVFDAATLRGKRSSGVNGRFNAAGGAAELLYFPDDYHVTFKGKNLGRMLHVSIDWIRFWLEGYEDPSSERTEQYERWRLLRSRRQTPSNPTDVPGVRMVERQPGCPGA